MPPTTLGIVATVAFQCAVVLVLLNSLIRFMRDAAKTSSGMRLWAAITSAGVLWLMSIYYGSSIARTMRRVGHWVSMWRGEGGGHPLSDSASPSIIDGAVFDWWQEFWLRNPPIGWFEPLADFSPGRGPLVIIALAYLLRMSIYLTLRERFDAIEELAASYWAHITAYLLIVVFAHDVFGWGLASLVLGSFVLAVLLALGAIEAFYHVITAVMGALHLVSRTVILAAKAAVRVGVAVARAVKGAREWIQTQWLQFVVGPVRRQYQRANEMLDHVDTTLEAGLSRAENSVAEGDA